MDTIILTLDVGDDHRLVIDLPADTPPGKVNVVITPYQATATHTNPAREAARAKLLAAGALVTDIHPPEGTMELSPEELLELGTLPPGSPSIDELIDEDRGPR